MHEAFFFGPEGRRLFGSYHPSVRGPGTVLTLVCPPLLNDYGRTHAALRRVSLGLAEAGHHVLRFDYRGTGDSSGVLGEVTISDWLDDLALAADEGQEISGCMEVRLLGVRGSALLICQSAVERREVQRVVLWDPVVDGGDYVQELRRLQSEMVARDFNLSRPERRAAMKDHGTYRLSPGMVDELGSLDAHACLDEASDKLAIVFSSGSANVSRTDIRSEVVDIPCPWEDLSEDLITPGPILERLVALLTER